MVTGEWTKFQALTLQEAAQALLSAQQEGCIWPNITDKIGEYLGRAEALKQLRGAIFELYSGSNSCSPSSMVSDGICGWISDLGM